MDREKKNTLQKCTLCEKKNFRKKVGQNAPTLDVIHERKGGHQKNSAGGTVKYFYGTFLKKCAASIHHVEIHKKVYMYASIVGRGHLIYITWRGRCDEKQKTVKG